MKHSRRGGYSRAVACWVPKTILPEVRRAQVESETKRRAARQKAGQSRARRHEGELARLTARIGELFPGMPEDERGSVVRRAFEVGSDRVGRTTKLEVDRKLELAVIAHARHEHTDYEQRLMGGEEREFVRRDIREEVERTVERWRGRGPRQSYGRSGKFRERGLGRGHGVGPPRPARGAGPSTGEVDPA
jgi:hypothetical protein